MVFIHYMIFGILLMFVAVWLLLSYISIIKPIKIRWFGFKSRLAALLNALVFTGIAIFMVFIYVLPNKDGSYPSTTFNRGTVAAEDLYLSDKDKYLMPLLVEGANQILSTERNCQQVLDGSISRDMSTEKNPTFFITCRTGPAPKDMKNFYISKREIESNREN